MRFFFLSVYIYINVLNRNFDALIRVLARVRMNWKKIVVCLLLYYGNIGNGIHATNIHDTNAIWAAIFANYSTDFDQSDILYNISMLRF